MTNLMEVCSAGHDLTLPDAYITTSSGNRACRECVRRDKGKKPAASQKSTKAAFDG